MTPIPCAWPGCDQPATVTHVNGEGETVHLCHGCHEYTVDLARLLPRMVRERAGAETGREARVA